MSYGKQLASQEKNSNILNNPKLFNVVGIPTTGIKSAILYAKILNIKYNQYITKNPKINRTFILKNNLERNKVSQKKYIYNPKLKNKKIILIDDSIVRGITMKNIISQLHNIGVEEVHIRICSPKIKHTCEYGIDIPTEEELLVNNYKTDKELCNYLNCNSIKFLELENIKQVMTNFNKLCTGCFNNNYKELEW